MCLEIDKKLTEIENNHFKIYKKHKYWKVLRKENNNLFSLFQEFSWKIGKNISNRRDVGLTCFENEKRVYEGIHVFLEKESDENIKFIDQDDYNVYFMPDNHIYTNFFCFEYGKIA